MKINCLALLGILVFVVSGCHPPVPTSTSTKPATLTDTIGAIKIGVFWAKPTKLIDYDTARVTGDTLHLTTCNEYVYSPFGIIEDRKTFKTSLLKDFTVRDVAAPALPQPYQMQILKYKSSKLIFFFDHDPEASKHSPIVKGEIYDEDVPFFNGIKIGMGLDAFYKTFFDYFPDSLKNKYKVIAIESCVTSITHVYTFQNQKLKSVKFISDYTNQPDY